MDSPVRQYLKQKDYRRHKLFRKINRRRKAERLLAIDAPMKELRRKLKRYKDGKDEKKELPYPLRTSSDYDDNLAYQSGIKRDEFGHMMSTTQEEYPLERTYLKKPFHPTYGKAVWGDMAGGYLVYRKDDKDYSAPNFANLMYTKPPFKYKGGKDELNKQMQRKPVTTGGAGYIPIVSSNFINDAIFDISKHLMQFGRNKAVFAPHNIGFDTINGEPIESMAQATYLTPRNIQKQKFLLIGYTEAPGDYGLVKKAVGDRNIPVYQKRPDDEKRENLIAIGNIDTEWFGKDEAELRHAGNYPTAIYINPENSKVYQKAWDLNDYSGNTGAAKFYNPITSIKANIVDKIGSPVVVTSGISEVDNRNIKGSLESVLDDFMYSKGLIRYRDNVEEKIPMNNTHGEPMYNLDGSRVYMTDKHPFTYYGLPEVTVYGKKKKGNTFNEGRDSGIHIKPQNRGKFTALKKRTGKSASWFKAHGTPALKKMATFALNSRHWSKKR